MRACCQLSSDTDPARFRRLPPRNDLAFQVRTGQKRPVWTEIRKKGQALTRRPFSAFVLASIPVVTAGQQDCTFLNTHGLSSHAARFVCFFFDRSRSKPQELPVLSRGRERNKLCPLSLTRSVQIPPDRGRNLLGMSLTLPSLELTYLHPHRNQELRIGAALKRSRRLPASLRFQPRKLRLERGNGR
jgi:hypothetical protein